MTNEKVEIFPFATKLKELKRIMQSKINKKKNIWYDFTCV